MRSEKIMIRLKGSKPRFKILFEGDNLPDIGLQKPTGIDVAAEYSPQAITGNKRDLYYVELNDEQIHDMVDPYIDGLTFGTDEADQIDYSLVNVVYKISGRQLALSRVNPSACIGENGRTMIAFGEDGVSVQPLSFMVELSGNVDAYYDGHRRIYFHQLSKAKALFRGFDEFYQEAYYDDKEAFLENKLFAVSEVVPEDIGVTETNKIAQIQNDQRLDLADEETADKIRDYVKRYPLSGVILNDDGRIKITTKEDLTCTVNLLTQRYFTSEITGEILQARGAERMKDQKSKAIPGKPEPQGITRAQEAKLLGLE